MRFQKLRSLALAGMGVVLLPAAEAGALSIAGPTSEWIGIDYTNLSPDPSDDQQTGQTEADIVGDDTFAALYFQYDPGILMDTSDDVLAFRLRLGGETNPSGFSHVALVGVDGDLDGDIDTYLVLDNTGSGDEIALYDPGSGANNSPNSTTSSITSFVYTPDATNYDWSAVTTTNCTECSAADLDLDGDGNDYFLSFAVPFEDVVTVLGNNGVPNVTADTPLSYVIGTSVQSNAYNQDLGGVDDDLLDPNDSWSNLGALSTPTTANGVLTPEPGTGLLLGLGMVALAYGRHRRRRALPRP